MRRLARRSAEPRGRARSEHRLLGRLGTGFGLALVAALAGAAAWVHSLGPVPLGENLEFSTVDLDTFQHDDEYGLIACPRDQTMMRKVDFNIDTTIILDYCPTCHGFWLDAKELASINEEVKRLNEAGAEVPDPLLVRISQFFWNLPLPH